MDDIVERLRSYARNPAEGGYTVYSTRKIATEAADELERLRGRTIDDPLTAATALAEAGPLVTPERQAVLDAAEKWHDSWGGLPPHSPCLASDVSLYNAVGALLRAPLPAS